MKQEVVDTSNQMTPEETFHDCKNLYEAGDISLDDIVDMYNKNELGVDAKILIRLASHLKKNAKNEEADQLYEAIAKNAQETLFNRGLANYQLERYEEAEQFLQKVPNSDPNHPKSIKLRSRSKLAQLFEKAGTQKSIEIDIDELGEQLATAAAITASKPKISDAAAEYADDEAEASASGSMPAAPTTNTSSSTPAIPAEQLAFEPFVSTATASTAVMKERLRQVQAERHFFSPYRSYKAQTRDLAKKFQLNRQASMATGVTPITAANVPARRMITADVSTVQASLECFGHQKAKRPKDGGYQKSLLDWNTASQKQGPWQMELSANTEMITLGSIDSGPITYRYTHRLDTHHNHLGNFHSPSVGKYDGIYRKLARVAGSTHTPNKDNEKQIAQWMQRYARTGQMVYLSDLQTILPSANDADVENLMGIFFHCVIKEPMRWMMPRDGDHDLPLATAQARAIKLIIEGYLNLKQVFDQDAEYGVFTAVNIGDNPNAAMIKINKINMLYGEKILLSPSDSLERVTTRPHLHEELVEMYGGSSDTDGQGYDSGTAHRLYPKRF